MLANRLSADPNRRVLLLEAGPRDWHPFIHMPAGIAKLVTRMALNWDYATEPEPALQGRRLWWPRGRVLGGSSSINAMCYVRGDPRDYDDWARMTGDARWSWDNVLPLFKRSEEQHARRDALHGADGPLACRTCAIATCCREAFVAAAVRAAIRRNDDFNGASQAGFGFYQVTQTQRRALFDRRVVPARSARPREPDACARTR